ncbi:helix-turn-helix transcriptional regulator [Lysinibacillus capsici]|uniref:helix-turn-helix transcriptional regulator n=1 Tax=Lysinibacillus capsici TaxID=2115968 RepID=UPI002E1A1478|nr:helix-turn-helix transcriptional regulator [Lysinibacillus capsici]
MGGLSLILREFNMTSKDLADVLGITRQSLNDWVRGKRNIPSVRLKEMIEFFNLTEEYFLKDEDEYTEVERLEVKKSYLKKTNKLINDPTISPYRFWSNQNEIDRIFALIENKKLLLRIEALISNVGRLGDGDYSIESTNNYYLFEKIEYVLRNESDNTEITNALRELFKDFKVEN